MYVVYIIYSIKFDRYYVGMSSDFKERLKTHNSGQVKSTKAFRPWDLFHLEEFETRTEARTKEKYLKSATGRRWRKHNLGM
ncbi:GIY-YIG nuclease family protein [Gelidibacter salicanalis]|uniref:GIY-YIG nuclease family protein n=1 Tax=Gelidibacter salicanalis TaxID=291193 RepID=A0A934KLM9_9FLAO|nr:GIY-YIG nuclease family protein [Gelidibacter salicanalis]MBJ7879504.1 GIY-YIG nuclease family protein [Gelidibacter salicanalis]